MAEVTVHWSSDVQPGEITALFGMSDAEAERMLAAIASDSVSEFAVNSAGHLIATLVDSGTEIDLGKVVGDKGDKGDTGDPGPRGPGGGTPGRLVSVVLKASDWSGTTQQAQVTGVTSDVVLVRPKSLSDAGIWGQSQVWCSVSNGVLTAVCGDVAPTRDLSVEVLWWENPPSQQVITVNPSAFDDSLVAQVTVEGVGLLVTSVSPARQSDVAQWVAANLWVTRTVSDVLTITAQSLPALPVKMLVTTW